MNAGAMLLASLRPASARASGVVFGPPDWVVALVIAAYAAALAAALAIGYVLARWALRRWKHSPPLDDSLEGRARSARRARVAGWTIFAGLALASSVLGWQLIRDRFSSVDELPLAPGGTGASCAHPSAEQLITWTVQRVYPRSDHYPAEDPNAAQSTGKLEDGTEFRAEFHGCDRVEETFRFRSGTGSLPADLAGISASERVACAVRLLQEMRDPEQFAEKTLWVTDLDALSAGPNAGRLAAGESVRGKWGPISVRLEGAELVVRFALR